MLRCCLSTAVGPIAGVLFISTNKLAFCSDKSIVKVTSPTGDLVRFHYKVVISLSEIQKVSQSRNVKKASEKYLQVLTMDDFEFWFMGLLSYSKMFKCLQCAICQAWQKLAGHNGILLLGPMIYIFELTLCMIPATDPLGKGDSVLSTINKLGGPIAGRLFISTKRMAFCSNEPIAKFTYPSGESVTFYYKVAIPLRKVKRANQSENVEKPSQKYLQVTTTDNFEFWFMGFLKYEKTFNLLQKIVSQVF
ncbi:hypothetical protein Cgig2_026780 [Carnegiea gigantea]|uniref:GRAM domain-containing protein n=1 Tax=Carnegiea gigantea TaxID=171969 RepID=A0A9Q1GMD0_9CARY|nr:hypothetical protein Cgig2_010614 [Carnegiea gigantea]KAJ8422892.1 hypothetical protein Cgig2_026780 [Carnegiea gigantea]